MPTGSRKNLGEPCMALLENLYNIPCILQTSLEEKNTKPFYWYIKAQKNDNFGKFPL